MSGLRGWCASLITLKSQSFYQIGHSLNGSTLRANAAGVMPVCLRNAVVNDGVESKPTDAAVARTLVPDASSCIAVRWRRAARHCENGIPVSAANRREKLRTLKAQDAAHSSTDRESAGSATSELATFAKARERGRGTSTVNSALRERMSSANISACSRSVASNCEVIMCSSTRPSIDGVISTADRASRSDGRAVWNQVHLMVFPGGA